MSKKQVHSHPEPSWTGATAYSTAGKRLTRWLSASDSKFLNGAGDDFTQNINWRIFRIMAEFVEGFEFLAHLTREVTVFGSARCSSGNRYYQTARELGGLCAKGKYTIITGGGPGIMEAANRGAFEGGGESVGLDISLPMEQRRNQYVKRSMGFRYFFTRKVMLSAASQAYVFFPGGFGTIDELFEIIVLIQTGKMSDEVPVILMGSAFWEPMLAWIRKALFEEHRFIEKDDVKIFHVVDSAKEAFAIIQTTHERQL